MSLYTETKSREHIAKTLEFHFLFEGELEKRHNDGEELRSSRVVRQTHSRTCQRTLAPSLQNPQTLGLNNARSLPLPSCSPELAQPPTGTYSQLHILHNDTLTTQFREISRTFSEKKLFENFVFFLFIFIYPIRSEINNS